MEGEHAFLPGGNLRLVYSLLATTSAFPVSVRMQTQGVFVRMDAAFPSRGAHALLLSLRPPVQGEHVFLPGGNLRLVEGLLTNIPILYNAVVTHVDYSAEEGVAVQVQGQKGARN